ATTRAARTACCCHCSVRTSAAPSWRSDFRSAKRGGRTRYWKSRRRRESSCSCRDRRGCLMALDSRAGREERVDSGGTQRAQRGRYLPIAEHGLIGDLHTVALVGTDGTIDWWCCPRFDSPSVFAAILAADRGGWFRIAPEGGGWTSKQLYLPDTNVLITRFLTPNGVGELQDFMPVPPTGGSAYRHRMIRRVVAVRGQMRFAVDV